MEGDVKTDFTRPPDDPLLPSGVKVRTYRCGRTWISVPGSLRTWLELTWAQVALRGASVLAGVLVDSEAVVFLRPRREPSFYLDL
jgi:hypothetical protein